MYSTVRTTVRAVTLAGLMAAAAGLAAACGGGGPASTTGKSNFQIALAYANCMRKHGDPNWPDPNSQGQFLKTRANDTAFQAPPLAYKTCQHLLPNGGQLTTAEQQAIAPLMLKATACMRAHGILNFPEPTVNANGVTVLPPQGVDVHSPRFQAAHQACQKYEREASKYFPPG
jgi:uncharacterized Zn-binding protein involved in type VI secretion